MTRNIILKKYFVNLSNILDGMPFQIKLITYYNLLNFLFSIIICIYFAFNYTYNTLTKNGSFDLTFYIFLIIIISFNSSLIFINNKFITGSINAYISLLIGYFIQIISFNIRDLGYLYINFSGFPIYFNIELPQIIIGINIVPSFFFLYLIFIRNNYLEIIDDTNHYQKLKENKISQIRDSLK